MFSALRKKFKAGIEKISKQISKKPREKITKKLGKKITRKILERKITEKDIAPVLNEFKLSLLKADVGLETAEKIESLIREDLMGKRVRRGREAEMIKRAFKKTLVAVLDQPKIDLIGLIKKSKKSKKPFLILVLGFNGSGKTMTIYKLANVLMRKKFSPVLAAADTYRAAAIEQIKKIANKLNVPAIFHRYGADPAAVVFDARKHAEAKGIDVIIADTAGRSHANINLMDELKKICRVNNPDFKLLVIDSLTGNDAPEQARAFHEAIGVDGIVLTKLDVNERGGAALSVTSAINRPILYLGIGQAAKDLEEFDVKKMIKRIIGP